MSGVDAWRLDILGGFRLSRGERVVRRLRTRKTESLLAFLALERPEGAPREELVEAFWPDADPRAGRQSLSQALSELRRAMARPADALGPPVEAERDRVWIREGGLVLDAERLASGLREALRAPPGPARGASLAGALSIDPGELLPGCCDEWALAARERLRRLVHDGLLALAIEEEAQGRHTEATATARRAVAADPFSESAHVRVVRLLDAGGDPHAALRHAAEAERLFRAKLDAPLSPEARALIRAIRARIEAGSAAPVREPLRAPPRPLTTLVGRERELAQALALLEEGARVLVVAGPPGVGASRLALEVALRWSAENAASASRVDVSAIDDAARLLEAVRDAVAPERAGPLPSLERIAATIGDRPWLIVLDGFARLAAAQGPAATARLLERSPALRIVIATTRRPEIPGAREVGLAPLETPAATAADDEIAAAPAVRLFLERARALRPDVAADPRELRAVGALCVRLEGLPLAIELVAARTRLLSPARLLERWDRRGPDLDALDAEAARDPALAAPRGRTLRAALRESRRLLTAGARSLLARLAACPGGVTLEAAEALAGGRALALMEELHRASLVTADDGTPALRCRMLDVVRAFALEDLSPGERRTAERRYAAHVLAVVEAALPLGPERVAAEHEGILGALAVSGAPGGDAATGLRLAWLVEPHLVASGHVAVGRAALTRLLAAEAAQSAARLLGLEAATRLAIIEGDYAGARAAAEEGLALSRSHGDGVREAQALAHLCLAAHAVGDRGRALSLGEEAVRAARASGDRRALARALGHLGQAVRDGGDLARTRALFEESRAAADAAGDRAQSARAALALGVTLHVAKDLDAATTAYEAATAQARALGDPVVLSQALHGQGLALCDRGLARLAEAAVEESRSIARRLGMRVAAADRLVTLGTIALETGRVEEARAHLEEARRDFVAAGSKVGEARCRFEEARLAQRTGDVAGARAGFEAARAIAAGIGHAPIVEAADAKLSSL